MRLYSKVTKYLCIGLSALSLVACGGGDEDNSKQSFKLTVFIANGINGNGLMLQNTAKGADNTPFSVARTAATTLEFDGHIAKGSDYDIKVVQQPEGFGQYCYIEQGKGTFVNADIAIQLKCVAGAAKVSIYAGIKNRQGKTNGHRLSAQFKYPKHIVFDSKDNLFITGYYTYQIRKITPKGISSAFAGSGAASSIDGIGGGASFVNPFAIAVDKDDNLYVGSENKCVRKITPNRKVTILAGQCGNTTANSKPAAADFTSNTTTGTAARFGNINGIVYDGDNALYVLDYDNQLIRKISINDGTALTATVQNIINTSSGNVSMGLSADKKTLYYISTSDYKLYQVDLTSTDQPKTAIALTTTANGGFKDGDFSVAQFKPYTNQLIASKSGQFLYLAEYNNTRIRCIDLINQTVTTIAGNDNGSVTNNTGIYASFYYPKGIAQDAQGNLFVSSNGHVIRKLELVKKP